MIIGYPGCAAVSFEGLHGRPTSCTGEPVATAVVRWRKRRGWVRVSLCTVHAGDVHDSEPMRAEHRELLAARREDWARGLAGRGYLGPPTSSDRAAI